ncbi:protein phosphatase 1 regulatory subunit 3B-like [Saccoglossus kowalevskii]|uniref:Glycogen-binding subunit 76A-like n=1 Tax=Saccoglossus kowalevskii TaxID=10224 RepID=A0ABM0MAQ9_SACKO|nr:PREDICTED: glycogen-binding subunit 76A-like [Saccoglossus kowalevskii]
MDDNTNDTAVGCMPAMATGAMDSEKGNAPKFSRRNRFPNGLVVDTAQAAALQLQDLQLENQSCDREVEQATNAGFRCRTPSGSCLKSPCKTPPTTPFEKKHVRFADNLGKRLIQGVRLIERSDSASDIQVPDYVYETLGMHPNDPIPVTSTFLHPLFDQPCADYMDFQNRLRTYNVCLENAVSSDLTVLGTVRVCNLGFHKTVEVRYTMDEWRSTTNKAATYVKDSCDGPTDRFTFGLSAPHDLGIGNRLEFAVCFKVGSNEFWDNNNGKNYIFECEPKENVFDLY